MIIRISILIFWNIAGILILVSCSPQKRLNRLLTLHPELVQNDPIRIRDTTIIPGVQLDTVVLYSALKDTITIEKENLQVKLFAVNDTVYLLAETKGDTVVVEKEIVVERVIRKKNNETFKEFNWIIIIFAFIGIILVIKRIINKSF